MNRNDTMTRGAQTDQLRDEISLFITENFLYMRPDHVLRPDDDLLRLALFDSLGFIELIEEIQDRYGIEVRDIEINEENFGSVNAIVSFVAARRPT